MTTEKTKSYFLPFFLRLLVLSILVTAIFPLAKTILPPTYITPAWPFSGLFFLVVTSLAHYILTRRGNLMVVYENTYMMVTVVRLLFFLSVILVYDLIRTEDALPFTIAFFLCYLIFQVFEVIHLYKHHNTPGQAAE